MRVSSIDSENYYGSIDELHDVAKKCSNNFNIVYSAETINDIKSFKNCHPSVMDTQQFIQISMISLDLKDKTIFLLNSVLPEDISMTLALRSFLDSKIIFCIDKSNDDDDAIIY